MSGNDFFLLVEETVIAAFILKWILIIVWLKSLFGRFYE